MLRVFLLLLVGLLFPALAAAQDTTPPDPITTLEVTVGKSTMVVAWQNTGDDGTTGNAEAYEVYRSQSGITGRGDGTLVASGSAGSSGSWTCTDYSGLGCNSPYYVAVFLRDEAGNWSALGTVEYRVTQSCNSGEEVLCVNYGARSGRTNLDGEAAQDWPCA